MLIRNRQGWRLLIVLSRLAVAGVLAAGLTEFLRPDSLQAQTERPRPSQRPATAHPRRPDAPSKPPAPSRIPPPAPAPGQAAATAPGPTPVESPDAANAAPSLLTLTPSLARLSAQRNALNQVLCKDRRHHLLLSRGEEALAEGDITTALQNFQALSDATYDAFSWPDDAASPRGARTSAEQTIRSLPPPARRTYERLTGGEARALQMESTTGEDTQSLLDLLQRFPHTRAGREVMERELLRASDAGQATLAQQYAQRLAGDEHHWNQLRPPIRSLIRRLLDTADQPRAETSGPSSSPPAISPRWAYAFVDGVREQAWDLDDSALRPAESAAHVSDAVVAAAQEWVNDRQERRLPVSTTNQPVVLGDLLVVRDFSGIRALDLQTGNLHWHHRSGHALASIVANHLRTKISSTISFQKHFAGQGPLGKLTSDGERVFCLEETVRHDRGVGQDADEERPATTNRLVALPLHPRGSSPVPVWTHPGPDDETLAGHCFLGPPLVVDGRLFVLSEFSMRLECIALDASDGQILWRQPIALAPSAITSDASRLRIACTPVYAAATLVCPTEVGVLVGVDPLTGSLRWVYDHIDEDQRHSAGRWSSSTQRNFGSCELPSRTLVHDGRIVHLPFRSASVHCVDASTGAMVWKVPRQGALSLSAADEHNILLIGPRDVTSLDPTDGSARWTTPCPEPAGHGILAGGAYLLPHPDGRCLRLSLEDGSPQGARFGRLLHQLAEPAIRPASSPDKEIQFVSYKPTRAMASPPSATPAGGNLSAARDLIVVTNPMGVAVYPMSAPLLADFERQLSTEGLPEEQQLQAAMLHLLLEDDSMARTRLQSLLETGRSPAVTRRAVRLLRELLFAELETAEHPRAILAQLQQLPGDEAAALRLLVHRIEVAIRLGEAQTLIAALTELQAHSTEAVIDRDGDAGYQVNAYREVADRLAQLRDAAPDTHAGELMCDRDLSQYISTLVEQSLKSGDATHRWKVARLFDGWPQVGPLRNELAAADITADRLQRAELLLLKNCQTADRDAAARAHRLLVELYSSAGLQREAAAHLFELEEGYRDADVGNGLRGEQFVQRWSETAVWQVVERRCEPAALAQQVRIVEHVCGDECGRAVECASARALDHHDRIRRKFLTGDDASLTILDRGILTGDRSHSTLTLINRDTGHLHGEVDVPAAYWQLAGGGEGYCGLLLPVSGRSAHGLSLLEKRCVWSSHGEEDLQREKVKIGPIGHDYCVLQTSRRLTVIESATGELCWFRNDLAPDVGLQSNESTGIIGDGETLTLFDADQVSYTVFRMGSGRLVRRGQLDLPADNVRRHRRAVGDRLVHIVSGDEGDRLRVWDAGSDEMLIDLRLHERLYARIPDSQQYACISSEGELVIVDIAAGREELRVPLPAGHLSDVSELNVAITPACYLVNLVGCEPGEPGEAVAAMDELELPAMRVQGLLMAISRSGEVHWSRPVPDAALLTGTHVPLPVLTLISRVRDADHRQPATLRIEVLDLRSGESLGRRSDLLRTRFVQSDDRHEQGRLTLVGLDSQIDIDFGPSQPQMLIHAEIDAASEPLTR